MGLDDLLEPISEERPCGIDLEYDDEFRQLEEAARGKPGSVVDPEKPGASIAAVPPNWHEVKSLSESILRRSKDFRAIAYLLKSEVAQGHLDQMAPILRASTEMAQRFWDGLFPSLEVDEDNDPTMRVNALACLADPEDVLKLLRDTVLFRHPAYGVIKFRSIETGLGLLLESTNSADVNLSPAEVQSAVLDGIEANESNILALKDTLDASKELQVKLDELAGNRSMLDLKPLFQRLKPLVDLVEGLRGRAAEGSDDAATTSDPTVAGASGGSGQMNREEAKRQILKACEFLERTEPSSPAPLFLKRALVLMDMSFLDIVRDLAPESLGTFEHYGASRNAE